MIGKKLMLQGAFSAVLFAVFSVAPPAQAQSDVDAQIEELRGKIEQTRENYREEGERVEEKIQKYENRIDEIQRNADAQGVDVDAQEGQGFDLGESVQELSKDFNEWRLKRAVDSYEDKIDDLKDVSMDETDPNRKLELEQQIQKLDAKYNAAKAKLNDLRATEGDNWERIERDLENSLEEIDRDYQEAMEG